MKEEDVRRLQITCFYKFCKFYRKTSVLESLFNKAAVLKVCNSVKSRLQHRCFPAELAKFLRTPFFIEEYH